MRKYTIMGYPDDLGVKNVGGRMGAAKGPEAFLSVFSKMKGKSDLQSHLLRAVIVKMGTDLEQNHRNAAESTFQAWNAARSGAGKNKNDFRLVAVGGGHDYGYSWVKGLRQAVGPVAVINIDAHFDLRPYDLAMTSGSPFRRLIDEKLILPKQLFQFGIQSHCNGLDLWEYAKKQKIKVAPFAKLRGGKAVSEFKKMLTAAKKQAKHILISLDLDALSFAFAPAVSAPQAEGFTASEIFQILEIAGADAKVISLGIFELAPDLAPGDLTARMAAQAAAHFLESQHE